MKRIVSATKDTLDEWRHSFGRLVLWSLRLPMAPDMTRPRTHSAALTVTQWKDSLMALDSLAQRAATDSEDAKRSARRGLLLQGMFTAVLAVWAVFGVRTAWAYVASGVALLALTIGVMAGYGRYLPSATMGYYPSGMDTPTQRSDQVDYRHAMFVMRCEETRMRRADTETSVYLVNVAIAWAGCVVWAGLFARWFG